MFSKSMSNKSRYAQRALGAMATGLFALFGAVITLILIINIVSIVRGQLKVNVAAIVFETLCAAFVSCLLNLIQTFRVLGRLNPAAYQEATRGMGAVAYIWSSRAAAAFLHRYLLALDCDGLPRSFGRRVRRTIFFDRLCMTAFLLAIAFGVYLGITT